MSRYIDADTVFNELTNRYKTAKGEARKAYREALDIVTAVEDIEVRHGRWKPFDLTWGRSVYACTSCGEALEVPTDFVCGKPMYEFCPNCGAKMEGAE